MRSSDFSQSYSYALVFVITINVVSAILFIVLVRRPVYDDPFNMHDVHVYATRGISHATVRAQKNPPGPTSFIWMSLAVRLLGGDELLDARIAVLFSWLVLCIAIVVGAHHSAWPELWNSALLGALVFPHSLTATATALTEGPALMFAIIGVLALTEYMSRHGVINLGALALGSVGGLSIGLAITCRQYYLALLPGAGLLALLLLKDRAPERRLLWLGRAIVPLAIALVPTLLMILTWGGITSPGMAMGTSYSNYQASVGVTWSRPIVAAFYAALYLVPFSFPAMWRVPVAWRWPAIFAASLVALIAVHFRYSLINAGPLQSLIGAASRIPSGGILLFWLTAGVTTFNAIAVALLLWSQRLRLLNCVPAAFAVLTVIFFIAEQLGVGGNIPFYDRYVLQLAPFLAQIGFWLSPSFNRARTLFLTMMAAVGHIMLWRYAFFR